jgi:hypothetical protein
MSSSDESSQGIQVNENMRHEDEEGMVQVGEDCHPPRPDYVQEEMDGGDDWKADEGQVCGEFQTVIRQDLTEDVQEQMDGGDNWQADKGQASEEIQIVIRQDLTAEDVQEQMDGGDNWKADKGQGKRHEDEEDGDYVPSEDLFMASDSDEGKSDNSDVGVTCFITCFYV